MVFCLLIPTRFQYMEELHLSAVECVKLASEVRQTEIHIIELLVPEHSAFEVDIVIANLKRYKFTNIVQIPLELIQAGGEMSWSTINQLSLLGIRKNCLSSGRSLLLDHFTRRLIGLIVVIMETYHCYQLHTKFIFSLC
jgi:hypothetical protein